MRSGLPGAGTSTAEGSATSRTACLKCAVVPAEASGGDSGGPSILSRR